MFTVSTPCFFEFLGLLNEFFLNKLGFGGWVWGSRRCACQRTDTSVLLISDRPVERFQPGPGSNFLAGAGDFWSRYGAQSDLLKL